MARTAGEAFVVLAVNTGSSSLKLALYEIGAGSERKLAGAVCERLGQPDSVLQLSHPTGSSRVSGPFADHERALIAALESLRARGTAEPALASHRLVHGGLEFTRPIRVGARERQQLDGLVHLAPLHLPPALACLDALAARNAQLPQIACFDTSFHASLPEHVRRLPVPEALHERGLQRYGFHGLSYEYALTRLGSPPPARLVMAHLGSGASLAAVRDGRCIDTSMAFTPAAGVVMSTRSGDLDPGLLLYLLRQGYDVATLEALISKRGGMLAVAGAGDVRELLERRQRGDHTAQLALRMFVYSVQKCIAAYAMALGGLDALVFTGGIGEHSSELRAEICAPLELFGVALDPELNHGGTGTLAAAHSRCRVEVVESNEELMLARHAQPFAPTSSGTVQTGAN